MLVDESQVFPKLYTYWMEIVEVHDGDTVTAKWDLGRNVVLVDEKIRLLGINAPEINKPDQREAGIAARDFLRALVLNRKVVIQTKKDRQEKFGRYLGTIFVPHSDKKFLNVNEVMIESGHAVRFMT